MSSAWEWLHWRLVSWSIRQKFVKVLRYQSSKSCRDIIWDKAMTQKCRMTKITERYEKSMYFPNLSFNPFAIIFVTHASAERVCTCSSAMHDEMKQTCQLFFYGFKLDVSHRRRDLQVQHQNESQPRCYCCGPKISNMPRSAESWYLSVGKLRVWDSRILRFVFFDSREPWRIHDFWVGNLSLNVL